MKLRVDKKADALYLRLDDSRIVDSREVAPGIVIDFDDHDNAVGIEMLGLSKRSATLNLGELQFQTD